MFSTVLSKFSCTGCDCEKFVGGFMLETVENHSLEEVSNFYEV